MLSLTLLHATITLLLFLCCSNGQTLQNNQIYNHGSGYEPNQSVYQDKILESSIQVLTFYKDAFTTGRRKQGVKQLQCSPSGTAGCRQLTLKRAQCKNQGTNGLAIQWSCSATMDINKYMFGKIEINCEGYDWAEDPYVLKGSCGLTYEIDLVKDMNTNPENPWKDNNTSPSESSTLIICIVGLIVFLVCVLRLCLYTLKSNRIIHLPQNHNHSYQRMRDTTIYASPTQYPVVVPSVPPPPYNPNFGLATGFGESTRR